MLLNGIRAALAAAACAASVCLGGLLARGSDAETLFVRRVEPLLAAKCAACHGADPERAEGGLSLASKTGLAAGGESGMPAIVPGRPDESPLFRAVARDHDGWAPMPPKEAERLSAEEVGWVREWIVAGAAWPKADRKAQLIAANAVAWSAEDGVTVPTSGGLSDAWTNRRYKPDSLWAYRPIVKPPLPADTASGNPIDAFIAARLPSGLSLAPPADRRTFLRRVTFGLTGLPPTPEETEAFLSDSRDDDAACHDVVERLLASPHHGERMAQHWLDVVRYADSAGFANDYERGNAWRYRDWVVRAFNDDVPYDRFTRDQIAGDEIDPEDPARLVATGFLRMGPWELTGMEVAKVARQRFLDDVTNSVGETFLGQSLQCARCHDHKFDPVPTRDYYAIQAVFATTQLVEREAPFLPVENTAGFAEAGYLERSRADHAAALDRLDATMLAAADAWFADRGRDPARWRAALASAAAAHGHRGVFAKARDILLNAGVPEEDFPPRFLGLKTEEIGLERVARKGLERLAWELDRYKPFALAVYSGRTPRMKTVTKPLRMPADRMAEGDIESTCILGGGDPFSPTALVQPGVLSAVAGPAVIPVGIEGRRRAFAAWVADADNPLTPRVIVNRAWMWHFGEPLAGNPNNFGGTGMRPSHPDLLDWLAATFVEDGWSLKALHRRILSTAAYRRSGRHPDPTAVAALDPTGTTFAVFRPRRLSAEELRDAMLSATGELNRAIGGIPVRPEIHPEAALQPRQVMGTFAAAWTPNPHPADRHRRSIYALKLRGLADPSLEIFNAPGPDFSCERRETSTVTPQVFALFNSRAGLSRALALANRAVREAGAAGDDAVIGRCFTLALGRRPRADEQAACLDHWRAMEALEARLHYPREPVPLDIRREAVEENTGETFTFTERLHAHADFVPDLASADCDARTRALADVCLVLFNTNEFAYVY